MYKSKSRPVVTLLFAVLALLALGALLSVVQAQTNFTENFEPGTPAN